MTLSKNQIKRHLQEHGLIFGVSTEKLDRRLEKVMGRERYGAYLAELSEARVHGGSMSVVYKMVESLDEANILMSHQSQLTVDIAHWFLGRLEPLVRPNWTIVDLGCSTGAVARVLATAFPDCRVIGVDRLHRFVELAAEACRGISNLDFQVWDYSAHLARPDFVANVLVSSLGIDFDDCQGHSNLDVHSLRESAAYGATVTACLPCTTSWRSVATPGSALFVVLRLTGIEPMLGFVDAAQRSGWRSLLVNSTKITEPPEDKIPAVCLVADDAPESVSEDAIASWYGWTESSPLFFKGAQAVAMYRSLGASSSVLRRARKYDDGHTMTVEVGRVGAMGFLFARATTGYAELQLGSLVDVDHLAPSFGWSGLTLGQVPT